MNGIVDTSKSRTWQRIFGQIGPVIALWLFAEAAQAAAQCDASSDDCVAVGRWNLSVSLGAGVRTNPLHHGRDIPLFVVPQFSYYGRRFFIDNLDPGFTLFEGKGNTLSLVASPGYDRVFFYRSDLQNFFIGGFQAAAIEGPVPGAKVTYVQGSPIYEVKPRHPDITYLAGPEWTFTYAGVAGQIDYLHEITGHNHGDEIRAALGVPLGQLGGAWKMNFGLTWKSAAIVNYYYGYPGIYDAGPALNPFIKIGFSRPLSRRWRLDAFVHCERLGNGIADSPIVGPRYVKTGFLGATYSIHH
jgi:outer membrane protein